MFSELDLFEFYCLNEDCPDNGKKGKGNIRIKERYGPKNRVLLRCNTNTHCFSETRVTIFLGIENTDKKVIRTLAMIPVNGSIRGTARAIDFFQAWYDFVNRINHYD